MGDTVAGEGFDQFRELPHLGPNDLIHLIRQCWVRLVLERDSYDFLDATTACLSGAEQGQRSTACDDAERREARRRFGVPMIGGGRVIHDGVVLGNSSCLDEGLNFIVILDAGG